MRLKGYLMAVMVAAGVLLMQGPAPAEITKCLFDVRTTQHPGQNLRLDFWVVLEDTTRPAAQAFSSVIIYNPDNTVLRDFSADYWQYHIDYQKAFFFYFYPDNIQTGTYKIVVADKSKTPKTLTATDTLTSAAPLPIATLINPPPNSGGEETPTLGLTDTLRWTRVNGAKFYRLFLMDESAKEPVFDGTTNRKDVYKNYLPLPPGVLIPGRNYTLRIEARNDDKNLMRRSRTPYIPFKTAPAAP